MVHIAGYCFFDLKDPGSIREPIKTLSRKLGLKGTVLLAEEGINLYLTGEKVSVDAFLAALYGEFNLPELPILETKVQSHAYARMLVKVKGEIITTGVKGVEVSKGNAKHLSPLELKKWLDEKREVTLLDTRNRYEVETGKFETAVSISTRNFRQFVREMAKLPEAFRDKPLVMYCTGGIRCEKLSAYMIQKLGFNNIYQLKGGVLNYFKQANGAHWKGECFVFDERESLGPKLSDQRKKGTATQPRGAFSKLPYSM